MHEGNVLGFVGQILHAVVHGEGDIDHVALLPGTVDADVGRGAGDEVDGLAVHLHFKLSGLHPAGEAHQHVERRTFVLLGGWSLHDGEAAGFGIGEASLLTEHDAPLLPVKLRRYKEVDV